MLECINQSTPRVSTERTKVATSVGSVCDRGSRLKARVVETGGCVVLGTLTSF